MNKTERIISQARRGQFRELLPDLTAIATRRGGARGPVWEAAAAAVQILFWQDEFARAAELAQGLIEQDGPLGGELCDQDVPFREALLAADLPAPDRERARARLLACAERVPKGRVMHEDFVWAAGQLPGRSVEWLLPNHCDWGGPALPLDGVIGGHLVDEDYAALEPRQQRLVWGALEKANDFDRADRLLQELGAEPAAHSTCLWMAGWYATRGEVGLGERMLLAAHALWWPYKKWDALPDPQVLQPVLRTVLTDRVREHYLTRPIGPEAEE
ncbi:hypothetical protein ACWGB8_29800 [Kitasatospora sp. NPDC054939]